MAARTRVTAEVLETIFSTLVREASGWPASARQLHDGGATESAVARPCSGFSFGRYVAFSELHFLSASAGIIPLAVGSAFPCAVVSLVRSDSFTARNVSGRR